MADITRNIARSVARDISRGSAGGFSWASQWYGIRIDLSESSPAVTRIASMMDAHKVDILPVHNQIKACLQKDDRSVNYYLDPDDWSKKIDGTAAQLDGTDGQVMMEWPDFYYRIESPSELLVDLKVSLTPLSGFTKVPKHYVSAYEATVYRPDNKLASVVNLTADYRGGNNNATLDAADNTQLGRPASSINRTNFRAYAGNRGTGWYDYGYNDHKWLYWMFVIEHATRNSQAPVVSELDSNGCRQGGLGNGVTNADGTEWSNFSGYYPYIPCGASNALGSGSGEVSYVAANFGGAGVDRTFTVNRYRGHELPYGHLWKICDGINVNIQADGDGGESQLWASDNPSDWNDDNYIGYSNRGLIPRANGYVSKVIMGAGADMLPLEAAGSSATYYCDYYYTSLPSSGEALRMLLVGGNANNGANAGFAYSNTNNTPSNANANIGSQLSF